jgi:predicted nucleic acid-binding protein
LKIVVNSTPIISLSLFRLLETLKILFDEVIVPEAVYAETCRMV